MTAWQNRKANVIASALVGLLCVLLGSPAVVADPPKETPARDSVSGGTPMDGYLEMGEVLPKKGAGYVLTEQARSRKARFGVKELVALVKQAAFKVHRKHAGGLLKVADLSVRKGGRIDHHGSHQNGRDVDFIFYLTDSKGNPVESHGFIPVDANGYSTDPPMKYRFDTKRNWALVDAMLRSDKAKVQFIFVSNDIKTLLINYAKENGASPRNIQMATQIMRQPGKKAHMDHFHVRIYCPSSDKPTCKDIGPTWAWVR